MISLICETSESKKKKRNKTNKQKQNQTQIQRTNGCQKGGEGEKNKVGETG